MFDSLHILCKEKSIPLFRPVLDKYCKSVPYLFIHKHSDFIKNPPRPNTLLLSYGSALIVKDETLKLYKQAINIHGASPSYPGRDPHHFACYDQKDEYGATAHFMTPLVDSGSIIDTELKKISTHSNSMEYLKLAQDCSWILIERLLETFFLKKDPAQIKNIQWGPKKTKRSDFLEMCKIDPNIRKEEYKKIYKAFQEGIPYKNLSMYLYGHSFKD